MSIGRNIAEISNLKEAQDAWETFFGRFFSSEIPQDVEVNFDPTIRKFKPRTNSHAKYNPPIFPPLGPKYQHLNFAPKDQHPSFVLTDRTHHSDDFDDFLNGNTVTIPKHIVLNKERLERAYANICKGNFELIHLSQIYYALWLFKLNKISRQQMSTILAMWQVANREVFRILNDDGSFTKSAERLLIPVIKENFYHGEFTDIHKERFRLLIQSAPKSEQIFYCSVADISEAPRNKFINDLIVRNSWYRVKDNGTTKDLHLSFGATDALQIAIRGATGAAASRPMIGKVSINTVKENVKYHSRPVAICIPKSGVKLTTNKIHNYPKTTITAVTEHDIYHVKIHNTVSPRLHLMLEHMIEVIIKHTKPENNWSKSLWYSLVDREIAYFRSKNLRHKMNIELFHATNTKFFEKLFLNDKYNDKFFPFYGNRLTDEGIAVIFDMVKNQDLWMKLFHIDINKISKPLKPYIDKMKNFIKTIPVDCPPELINFNFQVYCVYGCFNEKILNDLLKNLDLKNNLKFRNLKENTSFGLNRNNHTILELDAGGKKIEINEMTIKDIISKPIKYQFSNGNEINREIHNKLHTLATTFKYTYPKNELTNDLLDTSLSEFQFLEEKLQLLEGCLVRIKYSKKYNPQNLFDKIFSLFKDPFTASKDQHIKQIHEKINQVIWSYAKAMSIDDRDDFLLRLKYRNPELSDIIQKPNEMVRKQKPKEVIETQRPNETEWQFYNRVTSQSPRR